MIINNNALMDENLFNFQLEMADLQLYHSIQTNALEITTESDNIFIKIKNAIVNFFKKVINWIKGFFKKEVKEVSSKNTENKTLAKNIDKNKEFPITVSGGDNIFYVMSIKDFKNIANSFDFSSAIIELQTFKDFVSNAQTKTKEQLMHFIKKFSDDLDLTGPNFIDTVNSSKKEVEEFKNEVAGLFQDENFKIKLTPGGQINSQQELDKIIKQCEDNKELENLLSELEKNTNTLEKMCSDIESKIKRLSLDDKEIIKMLNNMFTITNIMVNGYIDTVNIEKNIIKKNVSVFNSLLKQLQ